MDASLSRTALVRVKDPHDWNSFDRYRSIHERRLAAHPFIDPSHPNTLAFEFIRDSALLTQSGFVYCLRDTRLEVSKIFETRRQGNAKILQVRGLIYRYIGVKTGRRWVMKYHNLHEDPNDYIHRAKDRAGKQILYEHLTRHQFPTFTEVLDELDLLTR